MTEQKDSKLDNGRADAGESGGGAYPNPHGGKKPRKGGFLGRGGQSEMGYRGHGQLGGHDIGDNPNAPTLEDDAD